MNTPLQTTCPIPIADGRTGLHALKGLVADRSLLTPLAVMHQHVGDIFQLTMPRFQPVVVVGPEANRQVLVTQRQQFSWRVDSDPVARLLRHGVLVEDGAEHGRLRALMEPSLQRRQVVAHVPDMVKWVDQVTADWQPGQPHDMLIEMRRVALLILVGALFQVDFTAVMPTLWPAILRTLAYIGPGLWILWPHMPRPGYQSALQQMDEYLYGLIRERRETAVPGNDLLSHLIATPGLDDDLIRDQLLTMFIAGHDTSTALLAWTLYLLGAHPHILQQAQAEVDAVLGKELPTADRLDELTLLDMVIKESLRLYPPIHVGNRRALTDIQVKGYDIPADTRLMYSIYLSHRHPAYWSDPGQFCPARFGPQAAKIPPLTYVPFGGGPRFCIGAAFAQIEAKVVLARLLQRFNFQLLPGQRIRPYMGATLEPHPGVMMRVWPRK
jgi:cytochrome P450